MAASEPNMPPRPTTEATACFGNMSETSVNRLAAQPWWADAARPISNVATQRLDALRGEDHRHDAQRADEQCRLAARVDRPAALQERPRQPAAADAAHAWSSCKSPPAADRGWPGPGRIAWCRNFGSQ